MLQIKTGHTTTTPARCATPSPAKGTVASRSGVANDSNRPPLRLLVNDDDDEISINRLARCIYAETQAKSLPAVEALCVMVRNTKRPVRDIASDSSVFESLNKNSAHHEYLSVDYEDPGFQMCLRSVRRMMVGQFSDNIMGATRFHRGDMLPDWATASGSVSEVGNLLFYI